VLGGCTTPKNGPLVLLHNCPHKRNGTIPIVTLSTFQRFSG
jgi:hypothetical protein